MGAISATIKKHSVLRRKDAKALEDALKIALAEDLDRALMHGYQMKKDDLQGALEIARRTFLTNL